MKRERDETGQTDIWRVPNSSSNSICRTKHREGKLGTKRRNVSRMGKDVVIFDVPALFAHGRGGVEELPRLRYSKT